MSKTYMQNNIFRHCQIQYPVIFCIVDVAGEEHVTGSAIPDFGA